MGKFTSSMVFEVVGGERGNQLVMTGMCGLPQIATDYRNVFYKKVKARPSTPLIARQFVISKNMFEFGPLLMNKDPKGYLEGLHPDNTAKLRITNNGLFDLHVDFSLKSKAPPEAGSAAAAKGGKSTPPAGAKKPAAGSVPASGVILDGVFQIHPPFLDLKVDETQELTLYAFPTEQAVVEDTLVCRIRDSPIPVEFPISVIGSKPQMLAYLDDGSPPPSLPPEPKPGEKPAPAPPNKLLTEGVQFGRLLVRRLLTLTQYSCQPILPSSSLRSTSAMYAALLSTTPGCCPSSGAWPASRTCPRSSPSVPPAASSRHAATARWVILSLVLFHRDGSPCVRHTSPHPSTSP